MTHYKIEQKRVNKVRLPRDYSEENIQIGVPVRNNEPQTVGLSFVGDMLLPAGEFGPTCKKNAYGFSYPDKTKQKEQRYVSTNMIYPHGNVNASPIPIDIYRKCYPKIMVPPLSIELSLFEDKDSQKYIIVNLTPEIRTSYLKEAINILLEIFGKCYVFRDEIAYKGENRFIRLNWEILPPGQNPSNYIRSTTTKYNLKINKFDLYRLDFLASYDCKRIATGINGFRGYYAFIFDNYCVLESAIYGNATYIIPSENWEKLSQKTKQELLNKQVVIDRIIHTEKWKQVVTKKLSDLDT